MYSPCKLNRKGLHGSVPSGENIEIRMGLSGFSCFTSGRVVMENMMRILVSGSPDEVWGTLIDWLVITCMAFAHGVLVLGPLCRYLSDTHLDRNFLLFAGIALLLMEVWAVFNSTVFSAVQ